MSISSSKHVFENNQCPTRSLDSTSSSLFGSKRPVAKDPHTRIFAGPKGRWRVVGVCWVDRFAVVVLCVYLRIYVFFVVVFCFCCLCLCCLFYLILIFCWVFNVVFSCHCFGRVGFCCCCFECMDLEMGS